MSAEPAGAIGLGLAAAAVWGAGDFVGGMVTRKAPPAVVVVIAHGFSLLLALTGLLAAHVPLPDHRSIVFGLIGGVAGGIGLMSFYKALSLGAMGLIASLTGVLTAVIPVFFALFHESAPRPVTLAGFGVAAVAIWLIAYSPSKRPPAQAIALAVVAGLSFGAMLTMLTVSAHGGVCWAIGLSRTGSTSVAILLVLVTRVWPGNNRTVADPAGAWRYILPMAAFAGLLDTSGNLLYALSSIMGRLDVAAVLSSLYPAATILLAAWLLHERTTRIQALGMGLALTAVVLISA